MPLRSHPAAAREIVRAARRYEKRVGGLDAPFLTAVEVALELGQEDLGRWAIVRGRTRRYSLRRFPYAVCYQVTDSGVWMPAVHHHRRHPKAWQGREDDPPRDTS